MSTEQGIRSQDDVLQNNVWDVSDEPHIKIDSEKCKKCDRKPCLYLCPAGCYTLMEDKVVFSYEGCLECGTCRVVCPLEAIEWDYPVGGMGIRYRYG